MYTMIPDGCKLETQPGECCPTLNCNANNMGNLINAKQEGEMMQTHVKVVELTSAAGELGFGDRIAKVGGIIGGNQMVTNSNQPSGIGSVGVVESGISGTGGTKLAIGMHKEGGTMKTASNVSGKINLWVKESIPSSLTGVGLATMGQYTSGDKVQSANGAGSIGEGKHGVTFQGLSDQTMAGKGSRENTILETKGMLMGTGMQAGVAGSGKMDQGKSHSESSNLIVKTDGIGSGKTGMIKVVMNRSNEKVGMTAEKGGVGEQGQSMSGSAGGSTMFQLLQGMMRMSE